MNTILVVEDDENLRLTLSDNLLLENYEVHVAATLEEAKTIIHKVDLCILDIMLPDGNGYDFCRWVRTQKIEVLILILTARTLESDLDIGFESGADDYLGKPYRMRELLLRVKALLRRKQPPSKCEDSILMNTYSVNWSARQVKKNEQPIHLTKTEFDLLRFFYDHLNSAKSRNDILDAVWGENVYVDMRTVDNFVANLKKQLNLKPGEEYFIRSVRGIGYCLHKTDQ